MPCQNSACHLKKMTGTSSTAKKTQTMGATINNLERKAVKATGAVGVRG